MNKFWKITGVVAVIVAVIAFTGVMAAFAQGPNQPDGVTPLGRQFGQNGAGTGLGLIAVDEATMHAAIAEALGLDVDVFEAAVAEGKTPSILAVELGVDFAEVQAAMDSVHQEALAQAVLDGTITQEQADWISSHRGGQNSRMNGSGNGSMGRIGRGAGNNGGFGGECPYTTS